MIETGEAIWIVTGVSTARALGIRRTDDDAERPGLCRRALE